MVMQGKNLVLKWGRQADVWHRFDPPSYPEWSNNSGPSVPIRGEVSTQGPPFQSEVPEMELRVWSLRS